MMKTRLALALSVALAFTQLLACGGSKGALDAAPAEPLWRRAAEARERATTRLAGMTDWSNSAFIVGICEESDRSKLTSEVKSRCAVAHLAVTRDFLKAGNVAGGRKAFDLASVEGASAEALASTAKVLQAAEAAESKKQRAAEAATASTAREAYALVLRQHYLDENMDIEVKASGKNNDRLTLKYVLFNAVWANKLEKGKVLLAEMRGLGFKRVDMTDGFDYYMVWIFENTH